MNFKTMEQEKDTFYVELIIQFFSDKISENDLRKLIEWVEESKENKRHFDSIRELFLATEVAYNPNNYDPQKGLDRLKSQIIMEHNKPNTATKIRKLHWRFARIAAIFIIALTLGGISYLYMPHLFDSLYNKNITEINVPNGSKMLIKLPDGTRVNLNAGSKFSYRNNYGRLNRTVWLEGEGFFDVAKDNKRSFIVKTEYIDIQAFGTQFNVKAFKDEYYAYATLVEGSIGVFVAGDINKNPVIIEPSQQAIFYKGKGELTVRNVDTELFSGWKDDKIFFEDEPLISIVKILERNFNYPVRIIDQELNGEIFTGSVGSKMSVFQLLDGMGKYGNFTYKIENDTIVISKK